MPLKNWNALLRGSVSHHAMLTRLHGRDPKTFHVIRTLTTSSPGASTIKVHPNAA